MDDDRSSATWHVALCNINYAAGGGGGGDHCATGTHSLRSRISLPPHTHICISTVRSFPKFIKKGRRAPRATQTSLTAVLNSCHDRRTGCPPDEYSQHSIDCLTHIWTLGCITYAAIYMSMNKYCRRRSTKRLRSEIGKYWLSPIRASFIYLLRMMNVPRAWFMIGPRAVTTGPPLHDL